MDKPRRTDGKGADPTRSELLQIVANLLTAPVGCARGRGHFRTAASSPDGPRALVFAMPPENQSSPFDAELLERAAALIQLYAKHGRRIATVESCTGGLFAGLLTEIAGSSAVVERGLVTYSNEAKRDLAGVPLELIARHGAVSAETARAMAEGGLSRSRADICVSITGIAGPGGGTAEKPVGLVHFAVAQNGGDSVTAERRFGAEGRSAIRRLALETALDLLKNSPLVL